MPVPSYPKVIAFGTNGTGDVLDGPVRIDEKVDGSQFGFGSENGELVFRSHGAQIYPGNVPSMFKRQVAYLMERKDMIVRLGCYFYAEALSKPKHNVLTYAAMPPGGMVLFDGIDQESGQWLRISPLNDIAHRLEIGFIPPLFYGEADAVRVMSLFDGLSDMTSALGGTPPEGIVVKNYDKYINIGGNVWPIFVKLVRQQFKEHHAKEWGAGEPSKLEQFIRSFKYDKARWEKAVQHLSETGDIEGGVRDIGKLCSYVQNDLIAEEKEDIKSALYDLYRREIERVSVAGLAEWYKERLANEAKDGDKNESV